AGREGLWTAGCAAKGRAATLSWPSLERYSGTNLTSLVKTTSHICARGRKSSKCGGSSLFQKTVGMPRRRHSPSSAVISVLGPDGLVSLNFHWPSFPLQADSTKTKSRPSSSADHCVGDSG